MNPKRPKIILIGAIDKGRNPSNGETMKNQLFIRRFRELFPTVIAIDTLNWKRRPWVLVQMFVVLLFNRRAKVIISASAAASHLITFLYHVPISKYVYFWVVGGNLHLAIAEGRYNIDALGKLVHIVVQGQSLVEELEKYGLHNAVYVPNSKPITFSPKIGPHPEGKPYRFVFLSRIHPDKGIAEILAAAKMLSEKGYGNRFTIDFYGKIETGYENRFTSLVAEAGNVNYRGYLNLLNDDGYQTLSEYDTMLFPTYWGGEGFPGIVIDANIAGVPIIATDWNLNRSVIEEGRTGFIIPVHDSCRLAKRMADIIDGTVDLTEMKNNCVRHVRQFDFRHVLSEELMRKIELY